MVVMNDPMGDFKRKRWEEQVKKNPLLAVSLGDLVAELHIIYALDPDVIKPKNEVPRKSLSNYNKYRAIIDELNNRENKYKEIPLSNRFIG